MWQINEAVLYKSPEPAPEPRSGAKNVKPASSSRSPLNAITCSRTNTLAPKMQSPPRPCPPGAFASFHRQPLRFARRPEPVTADAGVRSGRGRKSRQWSGSCLFPLSLHWQGKGRGARAGRRVGAADLRWIGSDKAGPVSLPAPPIPFSLFLSPCFVKAVFWEELCSSN